MRCSRSDAGMRQYDVPRSVWSCRVKADHCRNKGGRERPMRVCANSTNNSTAFWTWNTMVANSRNDCGRNLQPNSRSVIRTGRCRSVYVAAPIVPWRSHQGNLRATFWNEINRDVIGTVRVALSFSCVPPDLISGKIHQTARVAPVHCSDKKAVGAKRDRLPASSAL